MHLQIVTDSPSLLWIIGRLLNQADVTHETSGHQVSHALDPEQALATEAIDLVLVCADSSEWIRRNLSALRALCCVHPVGLLASSVPVATTMRLIESPGTILVLDELQPAQLRQMVDRCATVLPGPS